MTLPIELGWSPDAKTGWGLFALHLALGLHRQGRRIHIPPSDLSGVPATLRPTVEAMMTPGDLTERRIRFDPWGNHAPDFLEVPNRYRVLLAVFEDTEAVRPEIMNRYDLVLAPSRWVQGVLEAKGVTSTLFHQGYDDSIFYPAPRRRGNDGKFLIFSGGKLEFRKGQDIVVEAFRRFLGTPEAKDAVLVTAWENPWPQTMEGIWASGYVKGVPVVRDRKLDIPAWLEANGIPRASVINLGALSQAEMANAVRECDIGLFPNRCEGATNMPLVETLAMGVPCILADGTGQRDVVHALSDRSEAPHSRTHFATPLAEQSDVVLSCSLYRGIDGWKESSADECVIALQRTRERCDAAWGGRDFARPGRYLMGENESWHGWYSGALNMAGHVRRLFSWDYRTANLHRLLIECADG